MQNLISYDPRTETDLDELFRGFFQPLRMEGAPTPVTIKLDVTETENGYLVHSEMPGVKKEDIDVAIENNPVTITAEVKQEWERRKATGCSAASGISATSIAASRCRRSWTSRRARLNTTMVSSNSSWSRRPRRQASDWRSSNRATHGRGASFR